MPVVRRYGCRRDQRDPRDRGFKLKAVRPIAFPPAVDLRRYCPPPDDQQLSDCTAEGGASYLRWHVMRVGGVDKPLSRLQLYYNTRVIERTVNEDPGAEIRNMIKAIKVGGVAAESLWPYEPAKFKVRPPDAAARAGKLWSTLTYERVDVSIPALKAAMVSGYPVLIGVSLFASFESDEVQKTGVMPMPDIETEDMAGGHCMLAVGYGQKPGYFTILNSWGTAWGDKGYCYLPERYLGSRQFGADYWIIRNLSQH